MASLPPPNNGQQNPQAIRLPPAALFGDQGCSHHHDVNGKIDLLSKVTKAFSQSIELITKADTSLLASAEKPPHERAVPLSDARASLRKASDPLLLQKRTAIHFPPGTDVLSCLETACNRLDAHIKQVTQLLKSADCVDFGARMSVVHDDVVLTKDRMIYTQKPMLDAIELLRASISLPESA
jgi:hypothetical protein